MFKRTNNSQFGASRVDLFQEAVTTCSPRLPIYFAVETNEEAVQLMSKQHLMEIIVGRCSDKAPT